jgi:transposase
LVDVELWADIRRMHFVGGVSIKEIARRTGRDRNTIRRALRSSEPPAYRRTPRLSKLEPFKEEIHRPAARGSQVAGPADPGADRAAGLHGRQDDPR